MKNVISFSRRTDGPAFYMDRLEQAIEAEEIEVRNPYGGKISQVSLKPSDVAGFVFWSKNFEHLLKKWDLFTKYTSRASLEPHKKPPVYFQFTRNSATKLLEPNTPSLEASFAQLEELVELSSANHIMWRCDPIVFWKEDGDLSNNLGDFKEIATKFSAAGVRRCTISFATYYGKVGSRMKKYGVEYHEPSTEEMLQTTRTLVKIANSVKINIQACCNSELLKVPGISQSHCIDGNYLNKIWGVNVSKARDTGQRKACGCTRSKDIGGYGNDWKCLHGCLYCYANPDIEAYKKKLKI